MNNKQIDLLNEHGYDVLDELGFIKERHVEKPVSYIMYDSSKKKFTLGTVGTLFDSEDINMLHCYQNDITCKVLLIIELNELGDKQCMY